MEIIKLYSTFLVYFMTSYYKNFNLKIMLESNLFKIFIKVLNIKFKRESLDEEFKILLNEKP